MKRSGWLAGLFVVMGMAGLQANPRVEIRGRDLFLEGRPHLPHGMVHVPLAQLPTLQEMGIDSIHVDLPFNAFDPLKSDQENREAFASFVACADEAHARGMTVLWLFSFHYTPDWLWERHPDVRMKRHDGNDGAGGWIRMCLDHPGFRAEAGEFLTFIAGLLGPHPATLGYLLWNEPHLTSEVCYHPHTVAAFRAWLRGRYDGEAALNAAWGTGYAAFDDVLPPPPRTGTAWCEMYDRMVSRNMNAGPGSAAPADNPALWMDWMRFRQANFAAFWKWEADTLRAADPTALITSKIVPFDLYSSHGYGAGVNTETWTRDVLDVLGMDLYSHLDENFLARWKCDHFRSLSRNKPIWHTEFNFTFTEQRGLATPEQWRTAFYYQLARGVNGFWNFMWSDEMHHTVHYKGYRFAPVTHEIARLSGQIKALAPVLAGMQPAPAQVAVLHSMTTVLAVSGDYAPTADQSTMIDLLYRSHTPFDFVTEDMIRDGVLKRYRALVAVGVAALPDDVLEAIHGFTTEQGGHVFANARFAELDAHARPRPVHPPEWMGARATGLYRSPREQTGAIELRREARSVEDKPVSVKVKLATWSSRPIVMADGAELGTGNLFGDEDTQMAWSAGDRHEMVWEDIEVVGEGRVAGRFTNDRPAVVTAPQTVYVARDTCWVDDDFERMFRSFLRAGGVANANAAVLTRIGEPAASVDLRMWQADDRRLIFVINSAPTLDYDGTPVEVEVFFDAWGEVTDALSGETVPSRCKNFKRVIPLTLHAGDVRVLRGRPYPGGWQGAEARFTELKQCLEPAGRPYVTWRRSPGELWVVDARTELGMGMHGLENERLDLVKRLGINLVRHTVYWYLIEKTPQPGVYDADGLKLYDDIVERARKMGIELLLVVHGNPPGTGWVNRHESYRRFATFMRFMAARHPSVKYWELWNEMDSGFTDLFGARRPDYPQFERGRCYAQMLKAAYPAIKQANPEAWVLIGGLSGANRGFIRGIYEEGGRACFDFMNIHTYGVPLTWPMLNGAYLARMVMGEYGDFNRPLWNTEFGIEAGNLWQAWRVSTGKGFDEGQLTQWKTCIEDALVHRLYGKILPYQFAAHNASANAELQDPETGIELPDGHTIHDYGFGITRADGLTPRPTYAWLEKAQINRPIREQPRFTADVVADRCGAWEPEGYEFETEDARLTIRQVEIDHRYPTIIRLREGNRARCTP